MRHVWLLCEVPASVRCALNLPDKDYGIDIIAETMAGEFWAVQCKYREDETQGISWQELSTFTGLAFGVSQNITFALVAYNGDRITKVLAESANTGFLTSERWHGLDPDFWSRAYAAPDREPTLVPLSPRSYQTRAIEKARTYFGGGAARGKLIMACGTGKSLTAYWIARELKARTILVAVPSLWLMRQTIGVWLRELVADKRTSEVDWLCVCSDETVSENRSDDVALHAQDLGIPATTKPDDIRAWIRNSAGDRMRIVFTTYQSGQVLADALRETSVHFDLGIMDEAHKTVGDRAKLFSRLLSDDNVVIDRRVFMTATERQFQGESNAIVSMDDPSMYGETIDLMSFKEALDATPPVLSDYKIVTAVVSDVDIKELIQKNAYVRPSSGVWDEEVEAQTLAALIALRKSMQAYPIKHAVSFHSSIARAVAFKDSNDLVSKAMPSFGGLDTFHVQGATPTSVRDRVIRDFTHSPRALITNARCLTEGVDVPDIDCILFADPKRSTVDIVQAVGRALRPAKGKQFGYVIVPVVAKSGDSEELIDTGVFDEIIRVLCALAANDDRIIEHFRAIAERRPAKGRPVTIDIDVKLATHIDVEQFAARINLKVWSRLAKLSWRPFEEARALARSLGLRNASDWWQYAKGEMPQLPPIPADMPNSVYDVYKDDGWISWKDWLGTGSHRAGHWRQFEEARAFARSLGIRTQAEWRSYAKGDSPRLTAKPGDIPVAPDRVYKDNGWVSMADWLGTDVRSFENARAFARSLGLQSHSGWKQYVKGEMPGMVAKPVDIPVAPNTVYQDAGWLSWGDWLGTGRVATQLKIWRPFDEARMFARSLGLQGKDEWFRYTQGAVPDCEPKPSDVPAGPSQTYKKAGWVSWGDWLGTA